MLELPQVTLVCIDSAQPALALAALEQTLNRARFAEAVFVTDRDPGIDALRTIVAPHLDAPADRLRFLARTLPAQLRTSHALLIQWDAFVVNDAAWSDEFLDYDWVGPIASPAARADEAGVALLSRALIGALAGVLPGAAESLPAALVRLAATGNDLRFAPKRLRQRFAFGDDPPNGRPFAFQGLFNMWMLFQPADLDAFLAMAPPHVLASPSLAALALNLREIGRVPDAEAIARAVRRATQSLDVGLAPASAASRVALGGGASGVGRNDPCPCGSGRKYKQCHGQLAGGAPPPPGGAATRGLVAQLPGGLAAPGAGAWPPADIPQRGRATVLFHRARQALDRGDLAAAETLYRAILALDAAQPAALEYLGVVAMRNRRYDEAEPLLRRALELDPSAPEFHNNLGLLDHARGDFAAAAESYSNALALAPDYAPAHNNRGLALQESGRLEDAIACYRRAAAVDPAFAEAHWNLGLALLSAGCFEEGLVEHEWRLRVEKDRDWWARRRQFPVWHGEPLEGKRILVLAEQGLGDQIQFARYAEPLAARGATVVLETARELIDLLATAPGIAELVPRNGPYPQCDVQIPLMSLPLRCGTRPENVPLTTRYLASDAARRGRWQTLLGPRGRPRIGIAWAGNPEHVRDRLRSMALAHFVPLLGDAAIDWIGLQKGGPAVEMEALPAGCAIRDMGRHSETLADLAALLDLLDLVITVDTSIVHVAGALERPTLLLLDSAHDWRWPRTGVDSRWYASVRLVRQPRRGDWGGVVADVRRQIGERFGA
jgi:Flp pilus assembly protein TadD